jgi:hypothetical protein
MLTTPPELSESTEASRRIVTMVTVAFVAGLTLFLIVPAFMQLQADSFLDLYLGRWISVHGIPHHEVFTIANRGRPWIEQQWLAELAGYEVWRFAGYQGLAVLNGVTFAAAYGVLAAVMRRRGVTLPVSISFASFAMVSVFTLVFIRAQSLALPLFPGLLWLCVGDAQADRIRLPALAIVPLLALWANLHGSVLLGAGLAVGYLLYRAFRFACRGRVWTSMAYAALALAAAMAVLATPYGTEILAYYRDFGGNSAVRAADIEWAGPVFPALSFFQFVVPLGLAAVSILIAWWRSRRRPAGFDLWVVALTAVAALLAMRNNVWLGMAAGLLIADSVGGWLPTQPLRPGFLRAVAVAAIALAVLGVGRLAVEGTARYEALAPERAVAAATRYAAAHPCSRVLADILSVSVLLWREPWLAGRVAFDGRIELYTERALAAWVAFQADEGPHALDLARGYRILITSERSPALMRRLSRFPAASILAHDARGTAVLNGLGPGARCAARAAQPPSDLNRVMPAGTRRTT